MKLPSPPEKLTPYQLARIVYETEECANPLGKDLAYFLRHPNYVVLKDETFLLVIGKHDYVSSYPLREAYYVPLMTGDIRKAVQVFSSNYWFRPNLRFDRYNRPKIIRSVDLLKFLKIQGDPALGYPDLGLPATGMEPTSRKSHAVNSYPSLFSRSHRTA